MGEWKTVFGGEVEGRPVMVKVYDSEDDETEDGESAVSSRQGPSVMARGRWSGMSKRLLQDLRKLAQSPLILPPWLTSKRS